jgi:hypothetical protein
VIRPFGLHDITVMRQLQKQSVPLDLRRQVLYRDAPARAALIGYLTHHRLGPLTWLYDPSATPGDPQAFAQVWSVPDRSDWTLSRMAPALDGDEAAAETWRVILHELVRQAADYGVFRIVTRVDEGSQAEQVLRSSGYVVTTRHELFRLNTVPELAAYPRPLRPALPQDDWALGELYRQVVPRAVQEAETSFSHACASPRRYVLSGEHVREYVWHDEERVNAYLAMSLAPRGCWLEILVQPEYRADIMPHIRQVLSDCQDGSERPVYCAVPDYAVGLGWLLRTLGFEAIGRQAHMVMHVASRVPVRRPLMVGGLEGSVDIRTPVGTAHGSYATQDRPT